MHLTKIRVPDPWLVSYCLRQLFSWHNILSQTILFLYRPWWLVLNPLIEEIIYRIAYVVFLIFLYCYIPRSHFHIVGLVEYFYQIGQIGCLLDEYLFLSFLTKPSIALLPFIIISVLYFKEAILRKG